jgi:hypothetical protein
LIYIKFEWTTGGIFPHMTMVFNFGELKENQLPIKVIDPGTHTSVRLGQFATIC